MLYELIREIVSRILRDKVLVGLIVILILGSFWGGMQVKHEPALGNAPQASEVAVGNAPSQQAMQQQIEQVDPQLATDFVKWWLTSAMDYNPNSAQDKHSEAFGWMTTEAQQAFKSAFWSPEIAASVAKGTTVAAFHPISIFPVASNPDGSVVVCVNGTFVFQSSGRPTTQQIQTDYLIRRQKEGLRVAALYNRVAPVMTSSTY